LAATFLAAKGIADATPYVVPGPNFVDITTIHSDIPQARTFTKHSSHDPADAVAADLNDENILTGGTDLIRADVRLTRGGAQSSSTTGYGLYNIAQENAYDGGSGGGGTRLAPAGTLWALRDGVNPIGNTLDVAGLDFGTWHSVRPTTNHIGTGVPLVLKLTDYPVQYHLVQFTTWGVGGGGGGEGATNFAYTREGPYTAG